MMQFQSGWSTKYLP